MASLDVTAFDAALKQRYPNKKIKFVGYTGNPLLALMPKDESFTGKAMTIPVHYGGNQGASRKFATAQGGKTAGLYKAFSITRVKDYALSSIETEAFLASVGDEAAFMKASVAELDNTLRTAARNFAVSMYRNYGGARGQVGSISSGSLTLKNINDVTNFEVGMQLEQSTADGTSGSRGSGAATITGVNRATGVLTASAWTNFTANDYLFRKDDFGISNHGLASWLPSTAPSGGESYFGVDRSSDSRLYGIYHDGSAQSIVEALLDADMKCFREGSTPTHVMMNPKDLNDLRKSLGGEVVYSKVRSPDMANVSFSSIQLSGMSNGVVDVVGDRNCPQGTAYMLDMTTWIVASLGPAPRFLPGLGGEKMFIWDYNADSIEIRCGSYAEVGCYFPGGNAQILLPS